MKIRIGILFGGKSAEHEVSIRSATNIAKALDQTRFEQVPIYITKQGAWRYLETVEDADRGAEGVPVVLDLGRAMTDDLKSKVDIIFPVLHGPLGEDGTVQGLLTLIDLPFIGPGVLSSAVGMDKDVSKRLLRDAGIAIADYEVVEGVVSSERVGELVASLGLPLFIKPANMGSSVGVSRAATVDDVEPAIHEALKFDTKVLVEAAVVGTEIECAILGNAVPRASAIGTVTPSTDSFYSYTAKYIDENGAALLIPAPVGDQATARAQQVALATYKALNCEGLTRVDMFLKEDGAIIVNEINTLPGFTNISMYPKLWEQSGIGYSDLITQLVDLAIERFDARAQLETSYS